MAARGECFVVIICQCYLSKQNDSQSEEIDVIDESQAENRPLPVQEAEIRWKKFPWSAVLFVVLSGRSKDSPRGPLTVTFRLGELHVKVGYVSTLSAGKPGWPGHPSSM